MDTSEKQTWISLISWTTSLKGTFHQHCCQVYLSENIKTMWEAMQPAHLHPPWKKQVAIVLQLADICIGKKASNSIYFQLKALSSK